MEAGQRNVIRRLKPKLVQSIGHVPKLLDLLEAKKGLPKATADKIRVSKDRLDIIGEYFGEESCIQE